MRRSIELYIGDVKADIDEQSLVLFNYTQEDLSNPTTIKNSYSQSITLPGTEQNNKIFNSFFRSDRKTESGFFNPLVKTPFVIFNELGEVLERGYAKLDNVARVGTDVHSYSVSLYGGLGGFFYDLMYNEDGTEKTLADLTYYTDLGSEINPKETTIALTAQTISNCWTYLNEGTISSSSLWSSIVNFAPCYNGIPSDFDANKVILPNDVYYGIHDMTEDDVTYTTYEGVDGVVVTMANDKEENAMRDFRAYLQRPVVNVRKIVTAIEVEGYTFVVTDTVKNQLADMWMTLDLPKRSDDYSSYPLADLFEGTPSPARVLIDLAKTFGFVFFTEDDVITMMTRNEFYDNNTASSGRLVDLTERIDLSKDWQVQPLALDSKWYLWQNKIEGEYSKEYQDRYNRVYGSQKVNTGYEFDSSSKDLLEDLQLNGVAMVLGKSSYYIFRPTTVAFQPATFEECKFTLYNGTDGKDFDVRGLPMPSMTGHITRDLQTYGKGTYNDAFDKPEFRGENDKPVNGRNALLYFNGAVTMPSYQGTHSQYFFWHLTDDDTDTFDLLNEGKPMWDMRDNGIRLTSMPSFSRWNSESEKSLDFGVPLEVAVPNSSVEDLETIYQQGWQKYMEDKLSLDTRILRCWVNLHGLRPGQNMLRNFYFYDNALWVLTKIENQSLSTNDLTLCEFIKVQNKANYISGQTYGIGESWTLNVSPLTFGVLPAGETKTITVTSNDSWEVIVSSDAAEWLTVSKEEGTGDDTFTITASAFITSTYRQGTVTVRSSHGREKTIVVTQSAATYTIQNVQAVYTDSTKVTGKIDAAGSNYCYFTGEVLQDGVSIGRQTLTPTLVGSPTGFFLDSDSIKADNRGTTEGDERSASVTLTYLSASASGTYSVVQQANTKTEVPGSSEDTTLSFAIYLSSYGGNYQSHTISVTGARTHAIKLSDYIYTSGETEIGETEEPVTEGTTDFTVSCAGATVSGKNVIIPERKHYDTSKNYSINGICDGKSAPARSYTQAADTYVESYVNTDYGCEIYKNYNNITAAGGTCKLVWNAWHTRETIWTWGSDGQRDVKSRDEVEDTVTPAESLDTYNGFSRSGTTVTHLTMADNTRLNKRGQTATEKARYTVTNNGASDYVEFEVTNRWLGKQYGTPTVSYSGLDNDMYYDGTEIPVMVGISQQSWQAYDAGNYDIQTEGNAVLADSVTGTAYNGGYKSGSYIGAGELTTTTVRRRVYVISSVNYTDLGGTLRTFTSTKTIYQESLTIIDTHFYEITKFTVSSETSKVIGWGYQSDLPIYTEGRVRTDKHYIAGDGLPERPEWDVPGAWDIASGRTMGISGRGATGFTIPTNTSSTGTANLGCSQNTGDADRTLTLTASYGGQTATCTVTQEHRTAITITLFVGASTRTVRCNADSAVNSNLMMEVSVEWVRSGGLTFIQEYSVPITNGATSGQVTESATGIVGVRTYKILTIQKGAGDTTEYINGTP